MTESEFRHKIGDALYMLQSYEDSQIPDEVAAYPVARITERFVWVRGRHPWDHDRLVRFSRDDLERTGRAWNQPNRLLLYARGMPDWPLLVIDISDSPKRALTA